MAVYDTGNFKEGGAVVTLSATQSAYNFQESPAHNRGLVPIFPSIQFSSSIGGLNDPPPDPAGPLLDYIPLLTGRDFSSIFNATHGQPPGPPFIYFANGKSSPPYGTYPVGGLLGIAIFDIDNSIYAYQEHAKFLIRGPISGIVTTHAWDYPTATLDVPSSIVTVSLATAADSVEFTCPPGSGTGGFYIVFWPNIAAGGLPAFPMVSSNYPTGTPVDWLFGFPFSFDPNV